MSEERPPATAGSSQLRTLAVRMSEDLRAQLDVVAQLTGRTVTEEIRLAVEHWIDRTRSDPKVLKKAEAVRAEIEREALTRRNAIAAIFSGETPVGEDPPPVLEGNEEPSVPRAPSTSERKSPTVRPSGASRRSQPAT